MWDAVMDAEYSAANGDEKDINGTYSRARTRADTTIRTKALFAQMKAAAERESLVLEAMALAHTNGEFQEADSMTYAVAAVQGRDWERLMALREALVAEAKAWGTTSGAL